MAGPAALKRVVPADAGRTRSGSERPRMADVARLAGVSTATVSRALRQPEKVSPDIRRRVEGVIERLGYRRNLMAGALASARSMTIGVVIPSMINAFFSATIEAMEEGLAGSGYQLLIGNTQYLPDVEEHLIESMLAWSPAAIVMTGCRHSRRTVRLLVTSDVPVVEMWEMSDRPVDVLVGFSQREAGAVVARHFAERGARRLGFLGTMPGLDYRAADRRAGFFRSAAEAGFREPAELYLTGRPTAVGGADALARLIASHPDVDAVLCSNDVVALGALFEARRRGWDVPGRLKLCGFGDLDFAAASEPGLTTVRPPRREIGLKIAELLLARFAGSEQGEAVSDLGFELVARGST